MSWLLCSAAVVIAAVGSLMLLHDDLNGAVGGGGAVVLFGLFSYWMRTADYRRLAAPQRARCRQVQRTGVASGDPDVDQVARDLLRVQARSWQRSTLIVETCVAATLIAVPVAVAVTEYPYWWALTLPAAAFAAVRTRQRMVGPDPRPALARLET